MSQDGLLEIEPDRTVAEITCDHCGEPFQRVTGFVHRDGDAHAVYFASCYHHDGQEAFIDAVFSPTWEDGVDDHVTFGCCVGTLEGQHEPGASLVTGGGAFADKPLFGRELSREDALSHPFLGDFWAVVDYILANDPLIRDHVCGSDARPAARWMSTTPAPSWAGSACMALVPWPVAPAVRSGRRVGGHRVGRLRPRNLHLGHQHLQPRDGAVLEVGREVNQASG